MNYTKIIDDLVALLAEELGEKFDRFYEEGKVSIHNGNYDDSKDEWVDDYIVHYTCLDHETLDHIVHGEYELIDTAEHLRKAIAYESKQLDESSFADDGCYAYAKGHADGLSDGLDIMAGADWKEVVNCEEGENA